MSSRAGFSNVETRFSSTARPPRNLHPITRWVHVTRPAAATATGRERGRLGEVADTPAPCFARLRGVMNRGTLYAIALGI